MSGKYVFALFVVICAFIDSSEGQTVSSGKESSLTNAYHLAFVDVKDDGHKSTNEQEGNGWASDLRFMISRSLDRLNIDRTFSNDAKTDLYVICRFRHVWGFPVVSSCFTMHMTFVGKCMLKIVDKKTGQMLIEKSYTRKRGSGEVNEFINRVFNEWSKSLQASVPDAVSTTPDVSAGQNTRDEK